MSSYAGLYGGNWAYSLGGDFSPSDDEDDDIPIGHRPRGRRKSLMYALDRKMSLSCEDIVHIVSNGSFQNECKARLEKCKLKSSDVCPSTYIGGNHGVTENGNSLGKHNNKELLEDIHENGKHRILKQLQNISNNNSHLQYWSPQLMRSPRTRSSTVSGRLRSPSPSDSSRLYTNGHTKATLSEDLCDDDIKSQQYSLKPTPTLLEHQNNNVLLPKHNPQENHRNIHEQFAESFSEKHNNVNVEHRVGPSMSPHNVDEHIHIHTRSPRPQHGGVLHNRIDSPLLFRSTGDQNGTDYSATSNDDVSGSIQMPSLESPREAEVNQKNVVLGANNKYSVRFRFDSEDTSSSYSGRFTPLSTSSSSEMEHNVVGILRKTPSQERDMPSTDHAAMMIGENEDESEDDVFTDRTERDVNGTSQSTSYGVDGDDIDEALSENIRKIYSVMEIKRRNKIQKRASESTRRQVLEKWMDDKLKLQGDHGTSQRNTYNQRSSRQNSPRADEYVGKVASQTNGLVTPPPIPPRRYHSDYVENPSSLERSRDLTSEGDLQMVSPRSPSRRKRDAMLRKYNSTSALFSSADVKPLDRHSLTNTSDRAFKRYSYSSSSDDRDKNNNSETSEVSSVSNSGNVFDSSFDSRHSHTDLNMVDIVGETFQARYPWQRDAYTQCDFVDSPSSENPHSFPFEFNRSHSDDHVIRRQQQTIPVRTRPQSIGGLESISSDDFRCMDNRNGRRDRYSEPVLSYNSYSRKRMPIMVSDDPGSVSDLESIMENPSEGATDSSRHNSIESAALTDEISTWLRSRINREKEVDVLASPRVSPEMWRNIPDVIVNTESQNKLRNDETEETLQSSLGKMQYLSVPKKPVRRRSSGSVTSGSDESDQEISPPVARRGRRAAIVDTKNVGDMSPTNLSPEVSPCNSCDEGESGSNIAGRLRRRRSSVELALNVYPGDLLVQEHHKKLIKRNTISDFYAFRNGSTTNLHDDSKKQRQPFSLLKLMKSRSKESLTHLGDVLQKLKPSEFKDNHLAVYKNLHWSDLIASTDKQTSINDTLNISEVERKRRESVWELFKSECVFLIDHLMVLKHCFLEPLKKVQVEGFVMYAEPSEIFSNLDELCYVSYTFCKDFIAGLVKDMSGTDFGRTLVLIKAFQRFSAHSKDGSVYHTYCLNYTNALTYLEKLRKNDDFCEFEKWCEQDQRCNRLQLADLLIAPMQHCTKLPLLLYNIKKYTEDPLEKKQIAESIEKVETSLQQLEDKMKWLKNFERVQEIQRHLIWPSVTDLDSRAFVPEYLKPKLTRQPCERLLACPRRQLVYEGSISLTESTKSFDAFLFLFDDILLITKIKKPHRKKQGSTDSSQSNSNPPDNQTYVVHRQPIALDRLGIHDVSPQEAAANGLKYAFVIVQISRFQQIIDVFTLQATTELLKTNWLAQIRDAKSRYCNINRSRTDSVKENEDPGPANGTFDSRRRRSSGAKRLQHGKALSVDAIFL